MAETSNSELVCQETDWIKPSDDFVALDIRADEDDSPASQPLVKSFSRKGSQRVGGGGGETRGKDGGAINLDASGENTPLIIHVSDDGGHNRHLPTTAPTPGGKFRRVGRKPSPWLDPKRVLFVFATLSSMGTLILLYFTLSMGKMTSSNSDAR
ncbi:uncharacterized protein [Typha latifolia]|uniref:uncharacterized protein n=1 Tax=Typha latifolia TaxID=4733 RepID=UPI003C30B517